MISLSGAEGFRNSIEQQLTLMGERAPSSRKVLETLGAVLDTPAGKPIEDGLDRAWHHRSFRSFYERPLLVLAALRSEALAEGERYPLWLALRSQNPREESVTKETILEAMAPHRLGLWIALRTRRVQTNEVRRSVAWLWPAALAGCSQGARPIAILDVGASAGLNLAADLIPHAWHDRKGHPVRVAHDIRAVARIGIEPRPLDAKKADDVNWLRACVWPGERDRLKQLDAAVEAFGTARPAPELVLGTASSAPQRLAHLSQSVEPRTLVLAYQTIVAGYIPAEELATYEVGMLAWLRSMPARSAAWARLELENEADPELGVTLDVRVATGGDVAAVHLGRTGYHPSVIEMDGSGESELESLLVLA